MLASFGRGVTAPLVVLVLACLPARAAAQEPPPTAATSSDLEPPQLVESVEAAYPEEARAEGAEGTVVLRLTIDAEGRVTQADVIEPAGHGFDEAAREAALRFRFTPARRAGTPVAARIRYAVPFRLAAAPSPSTPPAAPTSPSVGATDQPSEPASAPPRVEPAPQSTPPPAVEVTVKGGPTDARKLQQSAEAVNVVDTHRAQQQSADLGEVMARTQGVAVRRSGGLGSGARFSLNGLYDDQIRFFLDGVPLEVAGYSFGIANVPVNLVERVEVYRGVVPIRFGADALGGAVNLVTDARYDTHAGASYQVGSFGTHRVTLDGRYRHDPSGFVVGTALFFDHAKNNYRVDVEVPDARGRLSTANVPRFHDAYLAYGGTVEAGFVDRPWARRLLVRAFASTYDKELQNNTVMTVPYGEATYGETVVGATARYEQPLSKQVELKLLASYARRTIDFVDKSAWVYDWFGRRIMARRTLGEIDTTPHDQTQWEDTALARGSLAWTFAPGQTLRFSVAPTATSRTGDERLQSDPNARDPLSAKRKLFTMVSGIEHEIDLFEDRLQNIVFVKDYVLSMDSEEVLPGNLFRPLSRDNHSFGAGDALRFRFTPWLYAKASYEYATRMPRADEIFGNGVLISPNLDLEPEVSHNANVGPRVELRHTPIGDVTADVNAFYRDSDRLVVLLGNDKYFSYQNVYHARAMGLENALAWVSPGRWVGLDGTLTYQDVRNVSSEGTFGAFEGDRIPNRPWLFASWGGRLRFPGVLVGPDALEPFYSGRFVEEFYRGWESQGLKEFKQVVPSQLTHNAGVSYTVRGPATVTTTFEVQNFTDAQVFDFFGVQRPGRAFYLKVSGEI